VIANKVFQGGNKT